MYIGSKDHILSLDLHDINKEPHIVSSACSLSKLCPRARLLPGLTALVPVSKLVPNHLRKLKITSYLTGRVLVWGDCETVIGVWTIPTGQTSARVDGHVAVLAQKSHKRPQFQTGRIVTVECPVFPLRQIHWPVSERRKMECLVSGKDANVSKLVDGIYEAVLVSSVCFTIHTLRCLSRSVNTHISPGSACSAGVGPLRDVHPRGPPTNDLSFRR